MKTNVITTDDITGAKLVGEDVVSSLETNGTYLPDVVRVVYSLKTTKSVPVLNADGSEKTVRVKNADGSEIKSKSGEPVVKTVRKDVRLENPILVTKVWWADGTVTTVRNSEQDPVSTEEVELENGSKVTVATEYSKTVGLAMAVVKRTCGVPDSRGEMVNTNLGRILDDIVVSAHDQQLEEAKAAIEKAKSKARAKEQNAVRKTAKRKRYSKDELMQLAGPLLEKLLTGLTENPEAADEILKILKPTNTGA